MVKAGVAYLYLGRDPAFFSCILMEDRVQEVSWQRDVTE